MLSRSQRRIAIWVIATWALSCAFVSAQTANPADATIDVIRPLGSISSGDQGRIRSWVNSELTRFTEDAAKNPTDAQGVWRAMRERFRIQYDHSSNSSAFKQHLAAQIAQVAVARFTDAGLNVTVGWGLAQVLVDLDRLDTVPGLIVGLGSPIQIVRYLCARGLVSQRRGIAVDPNLLTQVTKALDQAGQQETEPVVLSRIYSALAIPGQVPAVVDVFARLFDARLQRVRGGASTDRAELEAFDYFRKSAVVGAMTPAQKSAIVSRVAVFLRMDAQAYTNANLDFNTRDTFERRLEAEEDLLATMTGTSTGKVRTILATKGFAGRDEILAEVFAWVGDPDGQQKGTLNQAPWNVAVGAP